MATSKRDTLIVGLRNAYGLEGQAISTMEQQVLAQGRKPAEAASEARSKIEPLLAG